MTKKLEDLIPRPKKRTKSVYTMLRFDRRMDLLEHVVARCKELKCSKNAFLLALIEMDREDSNGK